MISFLRGVLYQKFPNKVLVEVNGLGYEVHAPLTVTERLPSPGEEVFLLTEFVIRETAHVLYGFLHERERQLFQQLMKTSGVGAKTVLAVMSAMDTDEVVAVLSAEDVGRLAQVPGIGKKTADRMVVDFRGSSLFLREASAPTVEDEVTQALEALGYKKAEIAKVLPKLKGAEEGAEEDTAARVRAALRLLSQR